LGIAIKPYSASALFLTSDRTCQWNSTYEVKSSGNGLTQKPVCVFLKANKIEQEDK